MKKTRIVPHEPQINICFVSVFKEIYYWCNISLLVCLRNVLVNVVVGKCELRYVAEIDKSIQLGILLFYANKC